MANPSLPSILFVVRQRCWRGAVSPGVLTSLARRAFNRNGQQQRLCGPQTPHLSIYRMDGSTIPDSFTWSAQARVRCFPRYAEYLLPTMENWAVRCSSTKATAAGTPGQKHTVGKSKKQEGAAACKGATTDLKGKRGSRTAKSHPPPSTDESFADHLKGSKQDSSVGTSRVGTLHEASFEEKRISQQGVVHGTVSGTDGGVGKRSDERGTDTESSAKRATEEDTLSSEEEEAERISREDYWKLQERTLADHSTHPPYMYPMDPEMQPTSPPLEPCTQRKRRVK